MFAFAVAFTTWTLRAVEADVRSSVADAQRALVRTTRADLNEKINLRREALTMVAGLLAPHVTASDAKFDAFFGARPELQKLFDALSVVDDLLHGSAAAGIGASVLWRDHFKRLLNGVLDIGHFKHINDSFGHAAGDAVLKEFALRLQSSVRTTDMAARLGGDGFVVLPERLHGDDEPRVVARKILDEVNQAFAIGGHLLTVTTSVGIVYQASAETTAPQVLALADAALYQAKAAGRNAYRMVSA